MPKNDGLFNVQFQKQIWQWKCLNGQQIVHYLMPITGVWKAKPVYKKIGIKCFMKSTPGFTYE